MHPSALKTSYLLFLVGAVSLGLLVACARESSSGSEEPPLDVVARELGFRDFSIDSFEKTSLEQVQLYQDTVTTCMLRSGFEYTPEYNRPRSNKPAHADGETAADYADTHGWGVTESRISHSGGPRSPNALYRMTLSEAERDAYEIALWRDSGGAPNCAALASQTVADESKLSVAFDEYGDQFRELVDRFWSDLRIITFHNEWTACMNERGYDYRSPARMQSDLQERSDAMIAAGPYEFDDVLEETLGFEIRAAMASLECGVPPAPAGQPEIYRSVLSDLANSFLRDNPEFTRS